MLAANRPLEFPNDIERGEVEIIRRVMSLQRAGQRSAVGTEGTGARIHELPRRARGDIVVDLILNAGAVPQLSIERQYRDAVGLRHWRTVIRKSCRPEPLLADSQLLPDRDLTGVREMQVGVDRRLLGRGDSDRNLTERGPVLPPYVAHHAPVRRDVVEQTHHHLLWYFHRRIDFYAADSRAHAVQQRAQIGQMRPEAELVVDWRLVGQPDAKFLDWREQDAHAAAEGFVPRLEREAAIPCARKNVVDFRLLRQTPDREAEPGSHREPVVHQIGYRRVSLEGDDRYAGCVIAADPLFAPVG